MALESEVEATLRRLGLPHHTLRLEKLHGDASSRTYTRVTEANGSTWVVMQMPPGPTSLSEEVSQSTELPRELPFVDVARCFRQNGLPVPQVLDWNEETRLMLLEDCGRQSLATLFPSLTPQDKESWYREAIRLLVSLQRCPRDESCIAFRRRFEAGLLDWEFDHFIEFGLEARLGISLKPSVRREIQDSFHRITSALVQLPTVLVHRDFQSRNLLVQGRRLRLIDFQDALLGPLPYDLVALLRDSYVQLDEGSLWRLVDFYVETKNRETGTRLDPLLFRGMFDWMTVQRKLKDAGRFVYIDRIKKNPSFLPYIAPSLQYVREALARQPELASLGKLLQELCPELAEGYVSARSSP